MQRSDPNIIIIPRAGDTGGQPATKQEASQPPKGKFRAAIYRRSRDRSSRRINVTTEHMDGGYTASGRDPVDVVKLLRENAQLRADVAILQNRLKVAEMRLNGETE